LLGVIDLFVSQKLPESVSIPWLKVCNYLDTKPIITYASVELYNYTLLDADGPFDLSNMAMMHTFGGGMDEAWFYLISIAIEGWGARALPAIVGGLEAVEREDLTELDKCLDILVDVTGGMKDILVRMYEKVSH
jgi:indoleamine 2,3-dioxygenase